MTKLIKRDGKEVSTLKIFLIAGMLAILALNAGCSSSTKSDTKAASKSQTQTSSQSKSTTSPQSDTKSNAKLSYSKDIAPILSTSCVGCHSTSGSVADLPLDNYTNVMKQVSPGNPDSSKLIKAVDGGSMNDKLNSDQLKLVKTWVEQGAVQ